MMTDYQSREAALWDISANLKLWSTFPEYLSERSTKWTWQR